MVEAPVRFSPSIAIVGSGPSGCYTAQFLRKSLPEAEIVVIDAEPVPYGLIRYGVAADHQGTKRVTSQFDRLFERDRVEFVGNVHVGRDLEPELLLDAFDVVVLATGSDVDKRLDLPVSAGSVVLPAGTMLRALNGHPDARLEELGAGGVGRSVAVIGNGNVALDVVRLLVKVDDQFETSDVDDGVLRRVRPQPVARVVVIGRSSAAEAKFDAACLKEVLHLPQVRVEANLADDDDGVVSDLLRDRIEDGEAVGATTVSFLFRTTPAAVVSQEGVTALQLRHAANDAEERTLPVDAVVTAIGFEDPREWPALLPEGLRVRAVGWLRRGPRGTIPENRRDAKEVSDSIIADLAAITGSGPPRPGLALLREKLTDHPVVDYTGWQRVDAYERREAAPGRARSKLTDRDHIVRMSRDAGTAPTR